MSYFQATDGTTLYYREYGDGRPIVLLASQGLSSSMWQHLMVRLADQGFRCVALDRRGHGRSDDPGKGYGFDRFAERLAQNPKVGIHRMRKAEEMQCQIDKMWSEVEP